MSSTSELKATEDGSATEEQTANKHDDHEHHEHDKKSKKEKKSHDKKEDRPSLDKNIKTSTLKPGDLKYVHGYVLCQKILREQLGRRMSPFDSEFLICMLCVKWKEPFY